MAAKIRVLLDRELDRPEQIEFRIAQLKSACPGGVMDAQTYKRVAALRARLPRQGGQPVLDASLLISKRDLAAGFSLRGDCLAV